MTHLDEGRLQAYLDDELGGVERTVAAEHVLDCGACREELDALAHAKRTFSAAVAELDVPTPATAPAVSGSAAGLRAGRWSGRSAFGGRTLLRAAALVLLFAAAASALVPGSPVAGWITGAFGADEPEPAPATMPAEPPVVAPAAPEASPPAGVSLPAEGRMEVAIRGVENAAIRLERGGGESVVVSAVAAERDPSFRTEAGRIEVVGGRGGLVVVEFPVRGDARLVVDGRRYAEQTAGSLTVLVPAEDVEGGIVWR